MTGMVISCRIMNLTTNIKLPWVVNQVYLKETNLESLLLKRWFLEDLANMSKLFVIVNVVKLQNVHHIISKRGKHCDCEWWKFNDYVGEEFW